MKSRTLLVVDDALIIREIIKQTATDNGWEIVGEANAEEVIRALALARIPLAGKHVGGQKGRRTVFDCGTGNLTIEIIGAAPVVL